MKKLFKYSESFGRQGDLECIFVATDEQVAAAKAKGDIYMGEVLGKHSEVTASFDDSTVKVLTDDQDFIAKAEEFGMRSVGTNPLHYIDE